MLQARDGDPTVGYSPQLKLVEGDQPVLFSYVLEITSPPNVAAGSNLSITPALGVISAPAGVSNAVALSFVSLNPAAILFTGPNQVRTITVSLDVPLGTTAGDYSWSISTSGWPAGTVDPFAFINAKITVPQVSDAPTVNLSAPLDGSTFVYNAGGPPLTIPLAFSATALSISPITSVDADLSGQAVTVSASGLGTGSVSAGGILTVTSGGLFTVRARATNGVGTSEDTAEFTVTVQAPPPTVAISQPSLGSSYTLMAGGTVSVPYAFSANSTYGGITGLTATLNGQPVVFSPLGIGTLNATGSGNFSISAGGTYELVVRAVDQNGSSTATRSFIVVTPAPPPTVTIAQPLNGATFTRAFGAPPTVIPFSFQAAAAGGYSLSSLTGSLNGSPVAATITGLGTANAAGTGNLSVTAPGTYTLSATATSGGTTASSSVTFTVVETRPPTPTCGVNWLPPISLGKVQKGGSTVAIKFELDCGCESGEDRDDDGDPDHYPGQRTKTKDKIDNTVVIAVSEVFSNGSVSAPQLFTYGDGYTIRGNDMYHLNFRTATGAHRYLIEVFQFPAGSSTPQVIGTKEFTTK